MRLLLADDQILFVDNLRIVLETRAPDFEVVGVAHNGQEAVTFAQELRPDIVLMDVQMPEMGGVEATRIIGETCPGTQVVVLTKFDDNEYIRNAVKYGAVGYLLKEITPEQLIAAIRAVYQGIFFLSSSKIASKFIDNETQDRPVDTISSLESLADWYGDLSRREKEVLECISKGYTNKETAIELCIAVQTVKNHVSNIYSKLGIHDRLKLIAANARRNGSSR